MSDTAFNRCFSCPARKKSSFAGVCERSCEKLDGIRKVISFKSGDSLPVAGGFFCIQQGQVGFNVKTGSLADRTIQVCGPGNLVGYGYGTPDTIAYSSYALTKGTACYFDRFSFLDAQKSSEEIMAGVHEMLLKTIRAKDRRIHGLETHSVTSRVASLLLEMNSEFGTPSEHGSLIEVDIDKKTLALLAGTVSETFARVITALEREKIVLRKGRRIHIVSLENLARAARN